MVTENHRTARKIPWIIGIAEPVGNSLRSVLPCMIQAPSTQEVTLTTCK
jgi:hypothetical protein